MDSFRSKHENQSTIRVLIANLTGVVAELITQALHQQPDIELLGAVRQWSEVNVLIGKVTILVIGVEDEVFSSELCLELLNNYPKLKILILKADSDEGMAYWLALHRQPMQVVSSHSLIESIRQIYSLSSF